MHHKFAVLLNADLKCTAVWTGSGNFTNNSFIGVDNAVILRDNGQEANPNPALEVYVREFARLFVTSEPPQSTESEPTPCLYPSP